MPLVTQGYGVGRPIAPIISSPSISSASITQDESATVTWTVANAARAFLMVIDGSGDEVHGQEADISGTTATAVVRGRNLPVAVYGAGQIELFAVDSTGDLADLDETLELTVTASDSSYQMQVAIALRDKLRDNARLSAIHDNDIVIIADESELTRMPNYPAIGIIADTADSLPHSVSLDEQECVVWVAIAHQHSTQKLTFDDTTLPQLVHGWARAVNDLCREEDEDASERLGGLTQKLNAKRQDPRILEDHYIMFIKVDATVLGK